MYLITGFLDEKVYNYFLVTTCYAMVMLIDLKINTKACSDILTKLNKRFTQSGVLYYTLHYTTHTPTLHTFIYFLFLLNV